MYLKTQFIQLIYITVILLNILSCNNKPAEKNATQLADSIVLNSPAVQNISNQIELDPENADLYYQRAAIYFNEKYLDRSYSDIEDAIKYDSQNPIYYYYKAKILYAMNKTIEAAKSYESAIALKPDYEEAQLKLAELYYVVKEHQKSIDLINVIITQNPLNADAIMLKGDNQRELKDTSRSIISYQKTLEIDPKYYDAALQLGIIMAAQKKPLAKDYFTSAIRINPKSVEAYFGRAFYYQQNREFQKALFDYRKVIALDPSNDESYYNVGLINFDAQQYDAAMRSWNICIEMNNEYLEAYYMRGIIYEIKKDKTAAKLNYEFALKLSPNYTLAQEGLKRVD